MKSIALVPLLLMVALAAPPTNDRGIARRQRSAAVSNKVRGSEGSRKRSKRSNVIFEDPQEEGQIDLRDELEQLSDDQLEMLSRIVQAELDKYDPEEVPTVYQIVDIPDEYLLPRSYIRDRRAPPQEVEDYLDDETPLIEEPQIVLVPQEALEEEEEKESLDDEELQSRIEEIAAILNERASRY